MLDHRAVALAALSTWMLVGCAPGASAGVEPVGAWASPLEGPIFSDESPIDTSVPGAVRGALVSSAAPQPDGGLILAWLDVSRQANDATEDAADIVVRRYDKKGAPLDESKIVVAENPENIAFGLPSISCADDGSCLVLWVRSAEGASSDADLLGARIDAGGKVIDKDPLVLRAEAGFSHRDARAAYDGARWVVGWTKQSTQSNSGGTFEMVHLGADGKLVEAQPLLASTPGASAFGGPIACDSKGCLAAWVESIAGGSHVVARRMSSAGSLVEAKPFQLSLDPGYAGQPAIGVGAGQYLVAWETTEAGNSPLAVVAARVKDDGTDLDPAPIVFPADPTLRPGLVGAGWDGTSWSIAYTLDVDFFHANAKVARLTAQGAPASPAEVALAVDVVVGGTGSLVCAAGGCEAIYLSDVDNQPSISFGVPIDATGIAGAKRALPLGANFERFVQVAADGQGYLATWVDDRTLPPSIMVAPLGADGSPTSAPSTIGVATGGRYSFPLGIAFGAGHYLVTWPTADKHLTARLVSPDGTPAGAEIDVGALESDKEIAVAFGTNTFLIAAIKQNSKGDALAARVSAAGIALDATPIDLGPAGGDEGAAVAFDGQHFLVLWVDRTSKTKKDQLVGARIDEDGSAVDAAPFAFAFPTESAEYNPTLACGKGTCVALWQIAGTDGPSGAVIDPASPAMAKPIAFKGTLDAPSVVHDGSKFACAWREHDGVFHAGYASETGIDESSVMEGSKDFERPCLASNGGGLGLFAYAHFDETKDHSFRAVTRRLGVSTPSGSGGAESTGTSSGPGSGSSTNGGCGCRTAPTSSGGNAVSTLLLVFAATALRRRGKR